MFLLLINEQTKMFLPTPSLPKVRDAAMCEYGVGDIEVDNGIHTHSYSIFCKNLGEFKVLSTAF